jgi:hypothetical protein
VEIPYEFLLGPNQSVYVSQRVHPDERGIAFDWESWGYLHRDSTGRVLDTIPPQRSWIPPNHNPGQFEPITQWSILPDGRVAVGGMDRLAFLLRSPDGKGPVLRIEGPAIRARVLDDERKEWRAVSAYLNTFSRDSTLKPFNPEVPDLKPAWYRIESDVSGRVVLYRYATATKDSSLKSHLDDGTPFPTFREPKVFSFFKTDGTYLGEVRFPLGVRRVAFTGDFAWAIIRDKDEPGFLVKYRIAPRR